MSKEKELSISELREKELKLILENKELKKKLKEAEEKLKQILADLI